MFIQFSEKDQDWTVYFRREDAATEKEKENQSDSDPESSAVGGRGDSGLCHRLYAGLVFRLYPDECGPVHGACDLQRRQGFGEPSDL